MSLSASPEQAILWPLKGGIHPPEMKQLSNNSPIERLPQAQEYLLPLPQVGETAALIVNIGDHVLGGQALTRGISAMYLAVHAPTSGTITAIEPRPSNHPSGLPVLTCVLQADGLNTTVPFIAADATQLTHDQILQRIRDAGIAGMGGAMFPSHIKLNPASKIEQLIINGVECEPYITSDDRLMREHAGGILKGVALMQQLITPKQIIIAIEDNKPEAILSMKKALAASMLAGSCRLQVIPTKYPSGGEKQLIQILTGREVPSGAIPAHLGIVVQNVGTAFAIQQAVYEGKPLLERVITVTGNNVEKPGNYWVAIGTPVRHILEQTGFNTSNAEQVIVGGPMMGYTLPTIDVPVLKGSNCLLLPLATELSSATMERSCIRCGECAQVCPASLLPQQLYWHAKATEYDKAEKFHLQDCIECGCCSYVCPSEIPLVEYYRVAKAAIRKTRDEKLHAEHAKLRFEARTQRLEQEKQDREAKARQAAEKRQATMSGDEKSAVAAALARVKAKQAAKETDALAETVNTAPTTDKQAAVAAAVARAKAKKAQSDQHNDTSNDASATVVDNKKAAVAAAIARAKAKKAQTDQHNGASNDATATVVDSKKAAVAAAVARAKAKKAAMIASAENPTDRPTTVENTEAATPEKMAADGEDVNNKSSAGNLPETAAIASDTTTADADKKARIAAAVAKAKAKKALAPETNVIEPDTTETPASTPTPTPTPDNDDKKARIAAAVAKAKQKARERAHEQEKN